MSKGIRFIPKVGALVEVTDRTVQLGSNPSKLCRQTASLMGTFPPAYLPTSSRSRSTSRTGGCPNSRLYSRLNCEASS
jgi:hypothetical protein